MRPLLFLIGWLAIGWNARAQQAPPAADTVSRVLSSVAKLPAATTHLATQQATSLLSNPVRGGAAALKSSVSGATQAVKGTLGQARAGIRVSNVSVDMSAAVTGLSGVSGTLAPEASGSGGANTGGATNTGGGYLSAPALVEPYDVSNYSVVHTGVSATVTLLNIPLQIGYQYEWVQGPGVVVNLGALTTTFDKNAFTHSLAARLQGKFNPADYLPQQYLSIDRLQSAALGDMQGDIAKVQAEYGGHLPLNAAGLNDWKTVNETDQATLERLVLPDSLKRQVASNKIVLEQLQARKNAGQPIDTAQYNKILTQNQEAKGYKQVLQVVQNYRNKWASSGLTSHLRQLMQERGLALANIEKDPTVIAQAARQNLSLNGVEKLFMDMKGLNVGRGVADQSPMTLSQSVMQNGLNTQLLSSASKLFSVTGGHMPSQGSSYESVFSGNSFNPDMAMAALSAGKGTPGDNAARVSIMSFKSTAASGLQGMLPTGGGLQQFVLTFSKDMRVGDHGHFTTEFSKSLTPGTGGIESDFFKTLGVSVNYSNEFPKIGLSHDLRLSSAAGDYSNPGNAYLFSGMKEAASNVRKVFFSRQMTVTLRNAVTEYSMDPGSGGDRFSQYTNLLDVRWRLKKGNYVSLKFQPSWSTQEIDGVKRSAGAITRVSADLNYSRRLGRHQYQSFTSLAFVRNTFPDSLPGAVYVQPLQGGLLRADAPAAAAFPSAQHSLQLTSQQSLAFHQAQLFFNNSVVYAPGQSDYVYLNSMWNTEAGYRYPLKGVLSASSSLNYTTVQGWYTQAGIRQSLSGRLSAHMTMSGSVDIGRNLMVSSPYPVPGFRGDLRCSYHF